VNIQERLKGKSHSGIKLQKNEGSNKVKGHKLTIALFRRAINIV